MRMKLKAIYIRPSAKVYNKHFEDRIQANNDKISDALHRYNCKASNSAKQEQPLLAILIYERSHKGGPGNKKMDSAAPSAPSNHFR